MSVRRRGRNGAFWPSIVTTTRSDRVRHAMEAKSPLETLETVVGCRLAIGSTAVHGQPIETYSPAAIEGDSDDPDG